MPENDRRTILVTGATRGLGRALVEGFTARGHVVLACGRDAASIAELAARHGAPHDFAAVDVASDAAVERWARQLLASHEPPDLLVNNAGLIHRSAPLWELTANEISAIVDVNLNGVANVIRHFVPSMIDRGRGVIVNVTSGWGRSTSPHVAVYCATKWAVEGLTLALAQELPRGLAAIPLNPGIIDTEMLRRCWGAEAGSFPTPEEWARSAVPYLLGLGTKDSGRQLTVPGHEE